MFEGTSVEVAVASVEQVTLTSSISKEEGMPFPDSMSSAEEVASMVEVSELEDMLVADIVDSFKVTREVSE